MVKAGRRLECLTLKMDAPRFPTTAFDAIASLISPSIVQSVGCLISSRESVMYLGEKVGYFFLFFYF